MRTRDFEDAMAEEGLVPADAPPLAFGAEGRPWYVSMILGGAGWLASLFLLLFVLLLFEPDTPMGSSVLGVLMLGSGFALYASGRESAFFEQLALALSLAGQLALMYAVGEATDSALAVAAFTAAMSAALVLWLPDHFAKLLSTFFACVAWGLVVRLGWWGEDLFDQRDLAVSLVPALLGWLSIWVPVGVTLAVLIDKEARWMASDARRVARPALTGLILALSLGTWSSEPLAALPWTPPGDMPVNWLALWPLLGVAAALFAAVSAFRLRHRAMIGVAIAGALLHLVHFYYLIGVSLVVKSYVMVALGVVLLLAARGQRSMLPSTPGRGSADR